MDFYTMAIATVMTVGTVCIVFVYISIKLKPQQTLFGKPVPSNLMPILISLFFVAGVVAAVFKPEPVKYPSYIAISPAGEIQYKY